MAEKPRAFHAWTGKSVPGLAPGEGRVLKSLGGAADSRASLVRKGKRLYTVNTRGSQTYLGKVSRFRSEQGRADLATLLRDARDEVIADLGGPHRGRAARTILALPAPAVSPAVRKRAEQVRKRLGDQRAAYRSQRELVGKVGDGSKKSKVYKWRDQYFAKAPGEKTVKVGGKADLRSFTAEAKAEREAKRGERREAKVEALKDRYRGKGGLSKAVGELTSRHSDEKTRERAAKLVTLAREKKGSLALANAIAERRKELAKKLGVKRTTSSASTVAKNPGHSSAVRPGQIGAAASLVARSEKGEKIGQDALAKAKALLASKGVTAKAKGKAGGRRPGRGLR